MNMTQFETIRAHNVGIGSTTCVKLDVIFVTTLNCFLQRKLGITFVLNQRMMFA